MLTSARERASKVRMAQPAMRAAEVGPMPAGAVTDGSARMPAPMVLPTMRAMAPNKVPCFSFLLLLEEEERDRAFAGWSGGLVFEWEIGWVSCTASLLVADTI